MTSSGLAVQIERGIIATVKIAIPGLSRSDPAGTLAVGWSVPLVYENDPSAEQHQLLRRLRRLFSV